MGSNQRTFVGKYSPNPMEFGKWVDLTTDPKGSITKVYQNGKWVNLIESDKDTLTREQILEIVVEQNKVVFDRIDQLTQRIEALSKEISHLQKRTAISE